MAEDLTAERIVALLPQPVVELISELSGSDDPDYHKLVAEFLRETAQRANAILYQHTKAKLVSQLPPDALAEHCGEPEL